MALRPRSYLPLLAALGLSLSVTACGPSGAPEDKAPAAEAPDTETPDTEPETAERRDKQEIIDEYETALEEARETEGPGHPALWEMSDEDTTVYLFGTVHILRPDVEWRTPDFNAAFESADTLVLELDMESEEGQKAVARDFMQRGLYGDGRTLSNELNDSDLSVITSALEPLGVPIAALDPMEPWMVAVNLSVMQLQQDGFDPNSGIERVLIAEAQEDGKSFDFLETAEVQANIFDTLPEPTQKTFLYETALLLDESSEMLDQVVDEWADGDVEGLGVLVANPDTGGGEGMYDALFVERNENWVPKIEALLDEPGTFFVAVGAGHLAGPDSVITMLREEGHEIEGP
ncbi:TraB/GumN family protein [Henriciella aquimarina]|uniref:TraB/GumN family protein n=1 Tax=Henriciella aquimarina TaxID=545261 RepID=UPI000A0119DD|nr:TraB/GumN family protein [Henriciella aquimarina]